MEKKTMSSAVIEALKVTGKPLSAKDIYEVIKKNDLYEFKAKQPEALLNSMIRKHCLGIDLRTSKKDKYFQIMSDGKYWLNDPAINK